MTRARSVLAVSLSSLVTAGSLGCGGATYEDFCVRLCECRDGCVPYNHEQACAETAETLEDLGPVLHSAGAARSTLPTGASTASSELTWISVSVMP